MSQNREPPSYQEYAASIMARTEYRLMSLPARGLLYSMRLECWVNGALPSAPAQLARVLGYQASEVEMVLPDVMPFFVSVNGSIRSPELDDYRVYLKVRRERQSQGGRVGAAKTNGARATTPSGKARVSRESLVQQSPTQNSQAKSNPGEGQHSEWVSDYERATRGH